MNISGINNTGTPARTTVPNSAEGQSVSGPSDRNNNRKSSPTTTERIINLLSALRDKIAAKFESNPYQRINSNVPNNNTSRMNQVKERIKALPPSNAFIMAPAAAISTTTTVNSIFGLISRASACVTNALGALAVASGAFSIIDGIRELHSSWHNHNRAEAVGNALTKANQFLDINNNNQKLLTIADSPDVQKLWTKIRDCETRKFELETQSKTSSAQGTENPEAQQQQLIKSLTEQIKTLNDQLNEKLDQLDKMLEKELPDLERAKGTRPLKDILEMKDLKTTLETADRLLKERRLDKAIVGCCSIAVGIVGVVANVMTLGLATPIVGLVTWGSTQAVKVCLRAYRTATSVTPQDRYSGVMVLKRCYNDVVKTGQQSQNKSELQTAKQEIIDSLKMPYQILRFASSKETELTSPETQQKKYVNNLMDKYLKSPDDYKLHCTGSMFERTKEVLKKLLLVVA